MHEVESCEDCFTKNAAKLLKIAEFSGCCIEVRLVVIGIREDDTHTTYRPFTSIYSRGIFSS
jgi:hypothetical protein